MATRDLTASVVNAIDDAIVYPFFVVELLFDSAPIRLWTGVGTLTIGSTEYIGTGTLLDISSIDETSEIAVRGADITLSGMNSEVISLALQSQYQGRVCNISFGLLQKANLLQENSNFILLEDGSKIALETQEQSLTQIFSGYMDEMNISEGPDTGTIELKVENKLIDLERARVRRFSSGYQKSIYHGDKGFDFVESLQEKEVVWGRDATGS